MRVLGVDPGLTGALALLDMPYGQHRPPLLILEDMPTAKGGRGAVILEAALAERIRQLRPDVAFVELVHSMPAQGVASTFTFGLGYGLVRGVLAGLGVPVTLIPPQKWGGLVQLPRCDDASRIRACQLFPNAADQLRRVRDHGRADAALIALAGYRLSSPF